MELTLTERGADGVSDDGIRRVVAAFYDAGRRDDILGPVFEAYVRDWDGHLSSMVDFWSSAVHRTGRYAGRPIEAHRRIEHLSQAHFDRWLQVWEETVHATADDADKPALIELARRMGASMMTRLNVEN